MWPFKTVKTLKESGILNGFVDWHSHILPGVDDGIKSLHDALRVLKAYEDLGFRKIWLTPHIMEDYPNTTAFLQERFMELKNNWDGNVELGLSSENMLDSLFEERLEKEDFLPMGDEKNHLLVETSYYTPPIAMEDFLKKIKSKGLFPILAHPERYRYMDNDYYQKLKNMGILFQLNFVSLVGGYGESARKKGEWLLSEGMVDFVGSDIHRLDSTLEMISSAPRNNTVLRNLMSVINNQNNL